ncbi:MAG: tRNA (N(6)-L-threonylcarbamoyladenosine(37)-C(2))-methylthiotransferase MtaB, partial [Phycisphaerae bacterium]|nr:tRNA (N(6)-L-threonylcarbamoyladenosine(37)-C(2))-methylthiotransferase MtaB [Phycisphaerae bacterium]
MLRFSITTLGCKVNQYEGAAISAALRNAGLAPAADGEAVDLVVVNTCCVTATAMRKSRQAIGRAVRKAPAAAVLVAGCYGDYDARRIAKLLASHRVQPDRAVIVGHHGDIAAALRQIIAASGLDSPNRPKRQAD